MYIINKQNKARQITYTFAYDMPRLKTNFPENDFTFQDTIPNCDIKYWKMNEMNDTFIEMTQEEKNIVDMNEFYNEKVIEFQNKEIKIDAQYSYMTATYPLLTRWALSVSNDVTIVYDILLGDGATVHLNSWMLEGQDPFNQDIFDEQEAMKSDSANVDIDYLSNYEPHDD